MNLCPRDGAARQPSLAQAATYPVTAPAAPGVLARARWPASLQLICVVLLASTGAGPALTQAQTPPHASMPASPRMQPQTPAALPSLSSADPAQAAPLPEGFVLSTPPLSENALPASLDEAIRRWQAAHRAVGEFPRGHVDLLRWEDRQAMQASGNTARAPVNAAPLDWPQVWQAVQHQQADRIAGPRANAVERLQAQRQWMMLERQARQAWVQAITQQALLRLQQERLHAAQTAHALGERMATLGHWSRARFIPVQQALAQEQAALIAAQWQARQSLETLAAWMGVWQAEDVQALARRLPTGLAAPPALTPPANAEGLVLAQRPALQWQREAVARSLQTVSPAQWARWSEELERLLADTAAPAQLTPQAQHPPQALPQWPASALRGDHALDKAVSEHRTLQREATALRSQVRLTWDQLQAAQVLDTLQHNQLLPLAQAAEAETLLRYNGMLQSTWDVIDAARARMGSQADALQARLAHWQAHIDWYALLGGSDIDPPAGVSAGKNTGASGAKGH